MNNYWLSVLNQYSQETPKRVVGTQCRRRSDAAECGVCSCHYENTPIQIYRKFYHQKNENFQLKIPIFFHISAQNIDYGYSLEPPRRCGSNEYPQSMFWTEIWKIMYTPVNPSFTIYKWSLRGSKLYRHVFVMSPLLANNLIILLLE